jgi:hypothetical protein
MKKSTHSKIKNTAILFELLTRQVAADTIKGVEKSPALLIIKEYFKADSILARELVLYQTLINERYNTSQKAEYLLNTIVKLRKKLNIPQLRDQKYKLISEVKKHYDLKDFFKTNLSEYKLYASIYRVFEGVSVSKVSETVQSRFTIIEHLNRKSNNRLTESVSNYSQDYLKQDEEIRLLAYKLMIDKFNEKYANLSDKQKSILKEYINNISNTNTLREFVVVESRSINNAIKKHIPNVSDQVTAIKLNEVCNLVGKLEKIKTVKEDHVLSLLLYHELLKELKYAK